MLLPQLVFVVVMDNGLAAIMTRETVAIKVKSAQEKLFLQKMPKPGVNLYIMI